MYSDTHTHLTIMQERGIDISSVLTDAAEQHCPFLLDIGTNPGDIAERVRASSGAKTGTVPDFLYFSAGLWPSPPVIQDRNNAVKQLCTDITTCIPHTRQKTVIAIGECGFDRKTNPVLTHEEAELFEMQIRIAQNYQLPLIIHSRDAFDETFSCIKNNGWDCGIIHCFSYTKREAKQLLDRGWYISFSGTITYKHTELLAEAAAYVPDDRIMIETDAPYLAPVPFRGQPNSPLLISNTYKKAAELRNTTPEHISDCVARNASALFNITLR